MVKARNELDGKSTVEGNRLEEILSVAAQLFYEQGYHATTIQDVADRVGMLKGSLYYYIRSKEDLLYTTLEQVIEKGDAYLASKLAQGKDPVEKLRLVTEAEIEYIIHNQVTVGLFLHEFHVLSARRRRKIISKMLEFEDRIVEVVKEGQAAGKFVDVDSRLAVYAILGMCNWIYRWYRDSRGINLDEVKSVFTRLILNGIVKRCKES
ncbi:MAG: TetR/AcrR family transcriptional regulator [Acidobacteria bacterium]|nr:TetR/AcrR family transcriptional regulator [Acidobacteriota bacterium]